MKSFSEGNDNLKVAALILCAGTGERTKLPYNKILSYVGARSVLETALDKFNESRVTSVILVINPADEEQIAPVAKKYSAKYVFGGSTRTQSVRLGLPAANGCDVVVIHDGARPNLTPFLIDKTIESAVRYGSGIAAVPAIDTVKRVKNGVVTESLNRSELYYMQTPQTFRYNEICEAYATVSGDYSDDGEVYALGGFTPRIVTGEYENSKITTPTDLFKGAPARTVIGTGFDVHPLVSGRKLIMGGVEIPYEKGLNGHSDADVLTHAIMDSLLSAAGLNDIGVIFPDTDKKTEGISSMLLLETVVEKVKKAGFTVGNVSAVIMAQKPKMAPYIQQMRIQISKALKIDQSNINVSATTTEYLGIIGEEKGIASSAVSMLFY